MKYVAHFPSNCPFVGFCRNADKGYKSFVRVMNYVEFGVMTYNAMNAVEFAGWDEMHFPERLNRISCNIYDEAIDGNVVTSMVFQSENEKHTYLVYITEEEE